MLPGVMHGFVPESRVMVGDHETDAERGSLSYPSQLREIVGAIRFRDYVFTLEHTCCGKDEWAVRAFHGCLHIDLSVLDARDSTDQIVSTFEEFVVNTFVIPCLPSNQQPEQPPSPQCPPTRQLRSSV